MRRDFLIIIKGIPYRFQGLSILEDKMRQHGIRLLTYLVTVQMQWMIMQQ